jgi:type VI secretion system FHA domain protein
VTLTLEITSPNGAPLGAARRKTFGADGGVIGRDKRSAWVLPHTKVSGRHAVITFQGGVFYIEDTSTNGVFINSSRTRLGKGRPYALRSGDCILIDPYVIDVSVGAESDARVRRPAPPPRDFPDDPFGDGDPFGQADPFTPRERTPIIPDRLEAHEGPVAGEEVDPLKLLGGKRSPSSSGRKALSGKDLELASPLRAHYQPPPVSAPVATPTPPPNMGQSTADPFMIPEDYDPLRDDDSGSESRSGSGVSPKVLPSDWDEPLTPREPEPATPAPIQFEQPVVPEPFVTEPPRGGFAEPPLRAPEPRATPAPVPAPNRTTPLPERSPSPAVRDEALLDLRLVLEGAGLDPEDVTPELARNFGRILRVVVGGVMEVLRARQQIKDEFRMRVTQFRPADNNPLKFSANVEDALHNLLVKRNPAYLQPVEAFDDAFDDVRHHQIAILAGMRTAFDALLSEFDPDRLQERFDRQGKRGGLLGVSGKLRYWDLYRERHAELTNDPDATFRKLFAEEFAREYEAQLQRLKAAERAADTDDHKKE